MTLLKDTLKSYLKSIGAAAIWAFISLLGILGAIWLYYEGLGNLKFLLDEIVIRYEETRWYNEAGNVVGITYGFEIYGSDLFGIWSILFLLYIFLIRHLGFPKQLLRRGRTDERP